MLYKQEWYTPAEVAVHNQRSDCWVSLNGKVLDLTPFLDQEGKKCACVKTCTCFNKNWFCEENCTEQCICFKRGYPYCDGKRLVSILLAYAGKDISHWFDGDDWIKHTHPVTGIRTSLQPHGHRPREPVVPSTRWRPKRLPWWMDEGYVVGNVTARTRPIRITNSLTGSTITLEVCSEETVHQIMRRYLPHNAHAHSYDCRYLDGPVDLTKTLEENGILDERDRFMDLDLPENVYIPNLLLCYNDDLTKDPQRPDCFCGDFTCMTNPGVRCKQRSR